MDIEKRKMAEDLQIPGKLLRYLLILWVTAANVGADFSLLFNARGWGALLLVLFLITSLFVGVWASVSIIRFHKKAAYGAEAAEKEMPEIV